MVEKNVILHVLNTDKFSGAEKVALDIIKGLKDMYQFIYLSKEGTIREYVEQIEDVIFVGVKQVDKRAIKQVVEKYHPFVIHAHDFTTSIISVVARVKCPVISHLHHNAPWLQKFGVKSILYGLSIPFYKKILLVSDAIQNEYVFARKIKKNSLVIGNPIYVEEIQKKAGNEQKTKEQDKKYDIIFVGRLSNPKDPLRFIELVRKIVTIMSVKTAMIGNGDLEMECRRKIQEYHLEDYIEMLGFQKEPMPIVANSKVLCVTSKWEGFGLAAVEALAVGVPVIATKVGGLTKIVTDDCGKLCENDDMFIGELERLLSEENYLKEKKKQAVLRAKELDNYRKYLNQIVRIYQELEIKK